MRRNRLQAATGADKQLNELAVAGIQARQSRNGDLALHGHTAVLAAQPFNDHPPFTVRAR